MSANKTFKTPTELELTEWFGSEPTKDGDGKYLFRVADAFNVTLVFSFDVIEASLQTALTVGAPSALKVVHEGMTRLWFEEIDAIKSLRAESLFDGYRTQLKVEINPRIQVEWSTLRWE